MTIAYREIIKAKDGELIIKLPNADQSVYEVILIPLNKEEAVQVALNKLVADLPAHEPDISEEEIVNIVKEVRREKLSK